MRPNPKFHVDEEQWALWLRPPKEHRAVVESFKDTDWKVAPRPGERAVVPAGRGRPLGYIHIGEKWILLGQLRPDLDLTTVSWLSDLCEKFPETREYSLIRAADGEEEGARWVVFRGRGQPRFEPGYPYERLSHNYQGHVVDVGYLGDFCARVAEVVERTPTYDEPEEGADPLVEHRYRRVAGPEDIPWYHATRAAFVESIMKDGLRTRADLRALGGEHESGYAGWSPGWNMGIRDAVYLTSDPEYAARIAETLAVRNEEDSVILEVDGKALEPSKVGVDEDALQDEFHGPSSSFADPDFPEYWTSLSSRIRSIAYLGPIASEAIKVVAYGRYRQERYFDEYRGYEVVDEDFEIEPVDEGGAQEEMSANPKRRGRLLKGCKKPGSMHTAGESWRCRGCGVRACGYCVHHFWSTYAGAVVPTRDGLVFEGQRVATCPKCHRDGVRPAPGEKIY